MTHRRLAPAVIAVALVAHAAHAGDPMLPDPRLTPGAVATQDPTLVCRPGYARRARHTSGRLKHRVYREYGVAPRPGHYEIDHLISLELGGADVAANLWPQSYDTEPWNARVKDQLENFLHAEVCAGRMPLPQAQTEIAQDWIAAYRRYLGAPAPGLGTSRPRG